MFRIEFLGLPGVGKTTVRRKLVHRLQCTDKQRYLTIEEAVLFVSKLRIDNLYRLILKGLPHSIALKFFHKLINRSLMQFDAQNRFLAEWGKSFQTFLSSIEFSNLSIEDRRIVISGFLQNGALFECINGELPEGTVVFFEEGFVQKSFMFITWLTKQGIDRSNLFIYLDHIPLPDLVIYIKSDLHTCYERMISRPQGLTGRLMSAKKGDILNFLEISNDHLKNVVCWLQKNKNVNFLEINNNQKIEDIIVILEKRIRRLFESDFNKQIN